MSKAKTKSKAVQAINKQGALLVYPLANRKEPLSIWSELYPRTKMRWEWDESGDNRVAELWHLREQLSRSNEVVYVKWFQGRATFFSKTAFVNLLAYFQTSRRAGKGLSFQSQNILEFLNNDSPLSTKQVKAAAELEGRLNESAYNRAMKPLWNYLYAVGYGEFQDSSFPSLGIGSSQLLFEDLWNKSLKIESGQAFAALQEIWTPTNPFLKFAKKLHSTLDKDSADTYTYNL